jgi:hypothetical protein
MILWVKNARSLGVYPTNIGTADFTISTPWSQTVVAGSNVTCTVTVNPLAGFANTVTLSANHLPQGITASFSPATITGSGSATLTLSASSSTMGGIYALSNSVVLSASSAIGTRSVPIAVTVRPRPFLVSARLLGGNFVATGTNGFPGATFSLLGSTNLALPRNQWKPSATNAFAMDGSFSVTNPVSSGAALQLFRVQY